MTTEHDSWVRDALGFDVAAAAGAVKATIQSAAGSAMLPDCRPVKGKVPGPAQHLICATHGHIVDIKEQKIIALSLDQYRSQKMGSAKTAHAASLAHDAPASAPAAPAAAPGQPASTAAAPSAGADAARADAKQRDSANTEAHKLLTLMQSEMEDIESIQAQYEELAGGGRLNRAISWFSDKLGGADDPGDELTEIAGKISAEQFAGIIAAGTLNFDAVHKHLATMRALNEKAHHVWLKYTGKTSTGAERAVTGLTVVSKAGDVATDALNVVAPGAGKILSVAKNVSVTGSKLAFGEKVNWTEFTVDMAFDLVVGGEGGKFNKAAEKLAGPLAKNLAPKLSEQIVKKWGLEAAEKKLGGKLTEDAIEKYVVTFAEERLKDDAKGMVKPVAEHVVESTRDKDITHGQLADMMLQSLANPSGPFAKDLSAKVIADFKS